MNENTARQLVDTIYEGLDKLCYSASIVRENCDAAFFDEYQLKVAIIVADAGDNLLDPILGEFPELRR